MLDKEIANINRYVSMQRWFDFEFEEINVFHKDEMTAQIRIVGGENIDLPGYEKLEIIFHDVGYINAPLSIRYEATEDSQLLSISNTIEKDICTIDLEDDEHLFVINCDVGKMFIVAKRVTYHIISGIKSPKC